MTICVASYATHIFQFISLLEREIPSESPDNTIGLGYALEHGVGLVEAVAGLIEERYANS